MKFNNRQNECIRTTDGRELWLSRSVAVVACVLAVVGQRPYILINQRGTGVPDFQGYWNLPCGYLDYDENTSQAAVREVWEECGVNLLEVLPAASVAFFDSPWDVNSEPTFAKQNVTIHHGLVIEPAALPALSNANNEPNETMEIRWQPLERIHELEFAFNHGARIVKFIGHVQTVAGLDYRQHLPLNFHT